ncbi:secreted trypsin-like serine protease [Nocardia sp. GAS34]|uniref:S1 family peptidase n=1 Tax=unclassified Nocardia TaxID=2637762 RepID=UPI003D2583F7
MHFPRSIAAVTAVAAIGLGTVTAGPATAVIGGHPVQASAYPWLAAIGSPAFPVRPSGQYCVGALIAPDKVLTAVHCAAFAALAPAALHVTFGRTDLTHGDGITVGVRAVRVDPEFRIGTFDGDLSFHHDLAILTLDTPVARPTVRIAAPHGTRGTVVGWGATSENDLLSNSLLRAVTVPLVTDAACAAAYGAEFDPAKAFCAGSTTADTGEFDSGGPLLIDGALAGITSWAKGAAEAGFPGVYARVPALDF